MKISGFSYVRNGFDLGYPFIEAVQSILPVCDEFVIAVGDSTDGTRDAVAKIDPGKIKIVDTIWNMKLREGGKVFAEQANIALDNITGNWAFHIQADEVIHENDLPKIVKAICENDNDRRVEGFILPFLHFWGSYNYIRTSRRMHRHEVRIFRNNTLVRSYADSQGFRKYTSAEGYEHGEKGEKLSVKKIDAPVYHYNGVRPDNVQKKKMQTFDYMHNAATSENDYKGFDYQAVDRLEVFTGIQPAVMKDKIAVASGTFEFDPQRSVWKTKDKIMQPIEDVLGFKIGEYRNYKLIK